MDSILEFLDKIGPMLYVVVPTIAGIYFKCKEKVDSKKAEIKTENTVKNLERYNEWEHEESQRIIYKIQDLCNYFKDRGNMDLVNYIQLENGTVATSKICNMFVSILAEDERFGRLPKMIRDYQRVPYSSFAAWIEKLREIGPHGNVCVKMSDYQASELKVYQISETNAVGSLVSAPIYDPNNILLGMCVFYYADKDYNDRKIEEVQKLLIEFEHTIQTIFLDYHIARNRRKKEFGLIGEVH